MPRQKNLGKERILEAAISYADEYGVDSLTMRKVAEILDCGAMSLYNHVANKDEMLTGMVDIVAGEIEFPEDYDDWKSAIRTSAKSAHDVLLKHTWAPAEWSVRMPGPARVRYFNWILKVLTDAELDSKKIYSGYHAITMHIIGFTLQEIGYAQVLGDSVEEVGGEFIEGIEEDFPYMADLVRTHLKHHRNSDEFRFVLDLILNGLEQK